jgi:hypothetical protein
MTQPELICVAAHLTGRLDDHTLLRTIAAILVIAGISLGVQAIAL